jgi:putative ABC transport system ATP-binding protein
MQTAAKLIYLAPDSIPCPTVKKRPFRKQHVGFIFQQFNLLPTMTVLENVAVPLFISGVPKPQALARAAKVLEAVELSDRAHYLPANISGGQQQRVAIGRALVRDPSLIICDEPTASLDGATGSKILTLLRQVAVQPGRCVIVVTHDNRILPFADRMVSMEDGRIQQVQAIAPSS